MASFAVLRDLGSDAFEIKHCHLNLWRLPGFLRERVFFDVGLHIAAQTPITKFKIVVPFSAGSILDLRQSLTNKETAALIFRRSSLDHTVSFRDADNIRLIPLVVNKCKPCLEGVREHSVWEVEIEPLDTGEEAYVRFRLTVQNGVPTWNVKKHLLLPYGAVMDFRIADTREARREYAAQIQWDYAVDIDEVNFFVVAPSDLQMQNASPAVYMSRLLEGDAWRSYLGRRTRKKRLSIFGWEYPAAIQPGAAVQGSAPTPINRANPYRVFLDVTREYIGLSLWTAIQNTFVILILLGILTAFGWWLWHASNAQIRSNLKRTGIIGAAVVVIGLLVRYVPWLRKIYDFLRKCADWIDSQLYSAS
jgi:hypothetical protein